MYQLIPPNLTSVLKYHYEKPGSDLIKPKQVEMAVIYQNIYVKM